MRVRADLLSVIAILAVFAVAVIWLISQFTGEPPSSLPSASNPFSTTVEIGRPGRLHLGVLPPATKVSFRCKLHNTTLADHRIQRVDLSCGCVRVDEAPGFIGAGGSADVILSMDTSSRHGMMEQYATITTDASDPERTLYRLRFSASIQGAWSETPLIEAGTVSAGSDLHLRYNIRVLGYENVRILGLRSTSKAVEPRIGGDMVAVRHSRLPGDIEFTQQIDLQIKLGDQARSEGADVIVDIDADGTALAIPSQVRFNAVGPIVCQPNTILWTLGQKCQMSGTVQLKHQGESRPEYDKVTLGCDIVGVEAKIESSGPDSALLHLAYSRPPFSVGPKVTKGSVTGSIDSQVMFKVPLIIIADEPLRK